MPKIFENCFSFISSNGMKVLFFVHKRKEMESKCLKAGLFFLHSPLGENWDSFIIDKSRMWELLNWQMKEGISTERKDWRRLNVLNWKFSKARFGSDWMRKLGSGFRTREKSLLQREGGLRSASRHHYLSCHVKPVKSVGRAKETRQYGYTDSRKQEKTSKEDR